MCTSDAEDARSADAISAAFDDGEIVTDRRFDSLLPPSLRAPSSTFWTPVAVAAVAARWFEWFGARRVIDLGAGVGKFCIVAASVTGLRFDGIERRGHLVAHASALARRLGVEERVAFTHGECSTIDSADYDGLYLYNPFAEHVRRPELRLDEDVESSVARYLEEIRGIESMLDRLATGSLVVTFHGFGGRLPDTFELVRSRVVCEGPLRCWRKVRTVARAGYWIEERELLVPQDAAR